MPLRMCLQQAAHDIMAPAAGATQHEQVVAAPGDVQPQRHRVDRPRLAERVLGLRQCLGGLEIELGGIAARAQLIHDEHPVGRWQGDVSQ